MSLRILRAPLIDPAGISHDLAVSCNDRYTRLRQQIDRFVDLSTELKLSLKLLVLGVAFEPHDGNQKVRVVYSHEGEEIGNVPTQHLNGLIHLLRGIGIKASKVGGPEYVKLPNGNVRVVPPGMTFGF